MDLRTFQILFTVIFFAGFVAMVIWVYWPGRKSRYQDAANLPFVDEPSPAQPAREQNHE